MVYEMKRNEGNSSELAKRTASTVSAYLVKNRATILATLPHGFNFDRMCRTVINAISTTPTLAKCEPGSLFLSTVRAFALGLEPNGALAEGYLVPFWNAKKSCNEAQFMPSYRGLQNLARRSGEIAEIYSKSVHAKDTFEVEEGTERKIVHKPNYTADRGEAVCYYAVFKTKDGGVDFEVMSKAEIDAIRARSKAAQSGPWVTDYDEMAKKTVMKRLLKRAPMSIELADAVKLENSASMGEAGETDNVLDIEGLEIPDDTPADIQREMNADRAKELGAKIAAKKGAADSAVAASAAAGKPADSLV